MALDASALARGNSVYLPDRSIPMLPHELSSGLCSLLPRQERLCLCVEVACDRRDGLAGREPRTLRRSACVLVRVEEGASERPLDEAHPPVAGSAGEIAARLRKFADAGADEIIIVANPITERAVRSLGDVVAALR